MSEIIKFHTQTCGRCGGSGHYSYCSMYGTVCFNCRGRKTVLTKAGSAASVACSIFLKSDPRVTARVGDLKPGDVVMGSDTVITVGGQLFTKRPRPVTLLAVEPQADGAVTLKWEEPELRKGPPIPHSETAPADARRPLPLTGDRWAAYLAFAESLGKGLYIADKATGAFLRGDDPKAAAEKREAKRAKAREASARRRERNAAAAKDADAKAMIELDRSLHEPGLRALLAAAPHPKIPGKTALDYAEWLSANLTPTMAMFKLRPVLDKAATVSREDL